ncbi:MAG: ABC transporter substrate-binding protein [Betaproteobacteria bacterium]|nr:ABC transporter substrate-binding protein [Betaproteobacteria bacterium]
MTRIRTVLEVAAGVLSWGAIAFANAAAHLPADARTLAAGRTLYLEGNRGAGAPLVARRAGGLAISGAQAACVNCHRRSGFGGSEGRSYIPPVSAASLFESQPPGTGASASGTGRPAYDDKSLARAIRAGVDPSGRRLDYLMPRYELKDAEMKSLIAYLRRLSTQTSPGVQANALDFATVVAPGAAPKQREAMVETLNACFEEHNAGPPPVRGRKRLGPEMRFSEQRKWNLHVWELEGKPETWAAQLAEYARRKPVFAVVGGLGGGNWAPVHEYCERDGLPCLFPRVEVPVTGEAGFYALYLSRGVLLEAAIVARHLAEQGSKRAVQVLRADDEAARAGAQALHRRLAARGIETQERRIEPGDKIEARIFDMAHSEALILWLRGDDLKRLEALDPVSAPVYLSAMLGGLEQAPLPAAWKARALMAYPYELPQNREARMAQLHAWLRARGLAPVDEAVQADAYIACSALGAGMNEVADHLHRDYLVERLEVIMGRGGFAGLYPRLTLGAGQRFSSKAGYLVRFADAETPGIASVGERMAP